MALDRDDIMRQVQGHLQSLRLAGVEMLPRGRKVEAVPWVEGVPRGSLRSPRGLEETKVEEVGMATGDAGPAERRIALETLAKEVSGCRRCAELCSTRTQTVFAQGDPHAELCFIGEAPGADEDAQGLPFVGAAGQLLNKIITACGLKREEVYICNILKCRPPGNRTPLPNEAANCRDFLERQLDIVKPKFIVALGGCAATNLLSTTVPLGKLRGRFHDFKGSKVLVTYHPAYLLPHRAPEKKKDVWEDMKMLLEAMGRPIPAKGT